MADDETVKNGVCPKNPFKISDLTGRKDQLDKNILLEGIYIGQKKNPEESYSLLLSEEEEKEPCVCCTLSNNRHVTDLKKGDVIIIDGIYKGKNELFDILIENGTVESFRPKAFASWNFSKMPTKEKMIRVQSEILPLYDQKEPFDCKTLVEQVMTEKGLDDRLEYKRIVIRGVASRFGTNPFKAPSVEISDTVGGKCYAFAVWEKDDIYRMVHEGDVITVEGNYLWTNPQWGVVIKNPEVKEIIPFTCPKEESK